jgi:hypothetical protein
MHRSKGTELFSKGYEMRRAALLKAKALVRSLSLAVCAPATHLNAPLIVYLPPVDRVTYGYLRVWAHTLGQLCGI